MSFPSIGGVPQESKVSLSSQNRRPLAQGASNEPKLEEEMRRPLGLIVPALPATPLHPPAAVAGPNVLPLMTTQYQAQKQAPERPASLPQITPQEIDLHGIKFVERPVVELRGQGPKPVEVGIKPSIQASPQAAATPLKKANTVRSLKTFSDALNRGGSSKKIESKIMQEKAMLLLVMHGSGEKVSPKDCEALGDQLKGVQTQDPQATTLMLRLYDTAAEIYEHSSENLKNLSNQEKAAGNVDAAFNYANEAITERQNAFAVRAKAAGAVELTSKHPLHEMSETLARSNKGLYGACGFQMETGSVQVAEGLSVQKRPHLDGKARDVLTFELTGAAREDFEDRLSTITANLGAFNSALTSGHGTRDLGALTVTASVDGFAQKRNEKGQFSADRSEGFTYSGSKFHEMEFTRNGKVVGKVIIGQEGKGEEGHYDGLYKAVRVEVPSGQDSGEGVKKMQQMLTVLGLGPVLAKSTLDQQERKKIGLIASSFYPQAWDKVQRDQNFSHMSPKDLAQKVVEMLPQAKQEEAKARFKHYADHPELIGKREVIPGKEMLTLNDLSTQMQKEGLVGFMCGVGNSDAAANICNIGFFSTQMRLQMGIIGRTASPTEDLRSGGYKSGFVRATTKEMLNVPIPEKKWELDRKKNPVIHSKTGERLYEEIKVDDLSWQFSGKFQFILNKELINGGAATCTYQDWYGVSAEKHENYPVFQNRDNLIDFTKKLGQARDRFSTRSDHILNEQGYQVDKEGNIMVDEKKGTLNEVGIPGGCIPPAHFAGINCYNEEAKQELLKEMSGRKLIENEKRDSKGNIVEGTLLLAGGKVKRPINEFLHVGNQLKQEMWSKAV